MEELGLRVIPINSNCRQIVSTIQVPAKINVKLLKETFLKVKLHMKPGTQPIFRRKRLVAYIRQATEDELENLGKTWKKKGHYTCRFFGLGNTTCSCTTLPVSTLLSLPSPKETFLVFPTEYFSVTFSCHMLIYKSK